MNTLIKIDESNIINLNNINYIAEDEDVTVIGINHSGVPVDIVTYKSVDEVWALINGDNFESLDNKEINFN